MFVDKPLLPNGRITNNKKATASCSKLQRRLAESFHTIEVQLHTVVTDGFGVSNTVSKLKVETATGFKSHQYSLEQRPARQSNSSQMLGNTSCQKNDQTLKDVTNEANLQVEFAGKREARHRVNGWRQRIIVQWYGYRPENYTLKPARSVF